MDSMHCYCFELLACTLLLLPLSVIDGASPATVDPCLPNPCQNSALCRSRGDGYSCFCVPGFQGVHCQIDVNECVSQPCRNGASCEDGVGRYSCVCVPGFTGATCERRIDDCHSQPCLNGGSCHDDVGGGFTCTCPPGFQGDSCENNTNECQSGPCQNGPLCIDGVNEYICDCSGRAFTGRNCETPVSPCRSEPCFNSAPCQDSGRNYTCDCWPGFSGHQCEIDIRECSSGPCAHGGRCIELSWQALYGSEPLLPQRYDQRKAAGYICSCPPGTAGTLCQELVDQCDPTPCQNGGSCESRVGGYVCHCLSQSQDGVLYGGVDCTVELVGCDSHQCQNQGSCTPFLADDTHGYSCSCPPGFTGPVCQTTTTFSFERSGYLLLQSPLGDSETSCIVTLSFRTVLPRAVLFQRHSRGLRLSLELDRGQLRLTLSKEALAGEETEMKSQSQALELPLNVTDGEWHAVEAVLDNTLLSFRLLDDTGVCESEVCNVVAPIKTALAALLSPLRTTFIGGVPEDSNSPTDIARLPAFIGCMQDVYVDWQLVVPQEWLSDSAENVSQGCSHRDRCLDVPCQNRGQCINLWQGYQCKCPRPYEGPDCEEEYVTARFGNEDSESYAAFTVADDLTHDLTVSLFLRTRRKTGLLLALANNGSQYLHMWLEHGKVKVQVNNSESLEGGSGVSDGESHFVSVEVAGERMTLYVEAEEQGHVHVGTLGVRAEDLVHVGGLPERRTTSAFGGDFKGCVQDLRINDRRLQFFDLDAAVMSYPLEVMANVSAGCSGDDVCSRNPCLNGGRCFSLWDDFACTCPPHTAGWRCEEVHWCLLSPCPGDAECRLALNQGYECYSNATFLNDSSILSYRGNGVIQRNLTSVSLSLRTRNRHAAVLHAEKGPAFITLSVQDGLLFMEVHGTAGGEETREGSSMVSLSSRRMVSDGEWHSVHLFMAAPWAQTSRWTLVLDEDAEEASTSSSEGNNLNFLRQGVDIFLGGLGPEAGWTLTGCLGTVELGGIALPYFSSTEVMAPRTQDEQFVRTSQLPPLAGCSGGPVCDPDPCLNGGACRDLFNLYHCSCAEGWAGRRCDFFTDTCASGPCAHGNCSVSGTSYECDCAFGFTGDDCDEEVDVCERHLCANGGTCLHGPDRYACLCAENYTGPHCNERVEEIPWYILVRNVRPKLLVSVCGDDTRNYTCFNGGNCTERELSCDCPQGFTGHRCEQEVDECKSNPCLNGGYCRNLINKFVCVCDMSYAGDLCQTDVSDIYFYVAVLLWQNLFQLLSYLILRLDDEPEVDWGGEE